MSCMCGRWGLICVGSVSIAYMCECVDLFTTVYVKKNSEVVRKVTRTLTSIPLDDLRGSNRVMTSCSLQKIFTFAAKSECYLFSFHSFICHQPNVSDTICCFPREKRKFSMTYPLAQQIDWIQQKDKISWLIFSCARIQQLPHSALDNVQSLSVSLSLSFQTFAEMTLMW